MPKVDSILLQTLIDVCEEEKVSSEIEVWVGAKKVSGAGVIAFVGSAEEPTYRLVLTV